MQQSQDPPRRVHFIRAFLASALGTGLSRVLGAGRDMAIANMLGASAATDVFVLAFTIPNMFRRFVADEGLSGALIPALAGAETEEGREAPARVSASVLGYLLLANVALIGFGIVAARPLVLLFAPSWAQEPDKLELAVQMTRWLMPFLGTVSLVSWMEGLLNYRGHFFVPKVAPGIVSGAIVASVLLLGGTLEEPVWAIVYGVLAGGVLHMVVTAVPLFLHWGRIGISFARSARVDHVGAELGKVVVIGIFAQVNIIVLRQIATALPDGSVTHFHNGYRVIDLAQGIIAVAIGSALLPNLALSVQQRAWGRFDQDLLGALRLAALLLVPVAVGVGLLAQPISALLFRHGAFTWTDTMTTAAAVRFLVPFILALGAVNIVKRVYFALDDRRTLIWVGGLGVLTTAMLGWFLSARYGVAGISMALSTSTWAQLLAYLIVLHVRLGDRVHLRTLLGPLARMAAASVPMGIVVAMIATLGAWPDGLGSVRNWAVLAACGAVGAPIYLGLAHLLGLSEVTRLVSAVSSRVGG